MAMQAGSMLKINGTFGFIKQDSGEGDMFVMPAQCEVFGGEFPPVGMRVLYEVVVDPKTGRVRAQNVQPEDMDEAMNTVEMLVAAETEAEAQVVDLGVLDPESGPSARGTMLKDNGKFGFVQQDSGEEDMFVMPVQCMAFGGMLPPIGARVMYSVVLDPKTGRARAEDVQPEQAAVKKFAPASYAPAKAAGKGIHLPQAAGKGSYKSYGKDSYKTAYTPFTQAASHSFYQPSMPTGTMLKIQGQFGFIQQDSGEADMFVMPLQCEAFGGVLPEVGTQVMYAIVADPKTGKPRAENVQPSAMMGCYKGGYKGGKGCQTAKGFAAAPHPIVLAGGKFQGAKGCKTGKGFGAAFGELAGTMTKINGAFGFIAQDNGEADMFVMPLQCEAFAGSLPEIGTRVVYTAAVDPKSGRPRAENVRPENGPTMSPMGKMSMKGKTPFGNGRASPYY